MKKSKTGTFAKALLGASVKPEKNPKPPMVKVAKATPKKLKPVKGLLK